MGFRNRCTLIGGRRRSERRLVYLEGNMRGRFSDDVKSAKDRPDGLRGPAPNDHAPAEAEAKAERGVMPGKSVVDGDPFAELDGLVVLRRLAQQSSKPGKTQSRFRRLRRSTRHDNKHHRANHNERGRRDLTAHPAAGSGEDVHTPKWCPTVRKNILMRADRSCPACGRAV